MRRVLLGLMIGAVVLAATPALARWVWRDGKWQYVDGTQAPPAPAPPTPVPPPTLAPPEKPPDAAPPTPPPPEKPPETVPPTTPPEKPPETAPPAPPPLPPPEKPPEAAPPAPPAPKAEPPKPETPAPKPETPKPETPTPKPEPKVEPPAPKPEPPAPKAPPKVEPKPEPPPKVEPAEPGFVPAIPKTETLPPGIEAPAPKPPAPAPKPAAPTLNIAPPAPRPETPAPKPEAPAPKISPPPPRIEPPAPKPAPPAPKIDVPAPRSETPSPKVDVPAPKAAPVAADAPAPEAKGAAPEASASERFKSWWDDIAKPSDETMLFERGRAELSSKDYRGAARDLKSLIKNFPASRNREEAMWLRAAALMGLEDHMAAFDQYEELITQYAGSPHYHDSLLKEIEIADIYFGPTRRKVLGIPLTSGDTEAVEILRKVYEHQPTGDLADDVVQKIADYYWSNQKWSEAEDYYDKYCREYPNGPAARTAELRRAKCAIERCRGSRYDTTCLQLAYDRLRQFNQKFPEEGEREGVPAQLAKIREMQAQALYETAINYYRSGKPLAAAYYVERLQQKFADTIWCEMSRQFMADISMKPEDLKLPAEPDAKEEPKPQAAPDGKETPKPKAASKGKEEPGPKKGSRPKEEPKP